jgi:type I restriction enzyme M protein
MVLALNKSRLDNLASDIWKSAERLRGKFKAHEYQNVILPIIVIRRLECVLIEWRAANADPQHCPFSNKTAWTLGKVHAQDHSLLEESFRAYIDGFSANVNDIIEHFNYRATIGLMMKHNRLAPILCQYKDLALGPGQLSGLEMGYVYEELLRRFSEQSGEEAGEHFTPREVIRLMVELLEIPIPDRHFSIYDPASGTGGILSLAKEHLLERAATAEEKARVEQFITLHGQELSPTNYAVCQADLLIKNDRQATVTYGNSLIPHEPQGKEPGDQWPESEWRFNRMLSNPPFGVTWGGKDGYEEEARKLQETRYRAGMPRANDGALLFLQTMLAKMAPPAEGGSRIAVVFNGSPLCNGDCGSGESEIRRWILENDWLEAIVMLPDQLFYNTGIFTYIWLLRNDKPISHRGRVMLIDARKQFEKEPKSFGNKRNRIADTHRVWIEERYREGWSRDYTDEHVKIFRHEDFAYHKVSVVFWQTDEHDQPAVVTEPYDKTFTIANVKKEQEFYNSDLTFRVRVRSKGGEKTVELTVKSQDNATKIFKESLDGNDEILCVEWTHRHYVQDDEYIAYGEDIEAFLKREIAKPIIRWEQVRKDGEPTLGYEILPNKYFYRYQPPMPAKDLLAQFWELEKDAQKMLQRLMK